MPSRQPPLSFNWQNISFVPISSFPIMIGQTDEKSPSGLFTLVTSHCYLETGLILHIVPRLPLYIHDTTQYILYQIMHIHKCLVLSVWFSYSSITPLPLGALSRRACSVLDIANGSPLDECNNNFCNYEMLEHNICEVALTSWMYKTFNQVTLSPSILYP